MPDKLELLRPPTESPALLDINLIINTIKTQAGPNSIYPLTELIWHLGGASALPIDPKQPIITTPEGKKKLNYLPETDPKRQLYEHIITELIAPYRDDILFYAYCNQINDNTYQELMSGKRKKPSREELETMAKTQKWDLYRYFNRFRLFQQKNPDTIKTWQNLGLVSKPLASETQINSRTLQEVRKAHPLPPTHYNLDFLFDETTFNFTEGAPTHQSMVRYIQRLDQAMAMIREMENDPKPTAQTRQIKEIVGKRLTNFTHQAIEQILLAAECGQCQLNNKEKTKLSAILNIEDCSFIFGWDRNLKEIIGKSNWKKEMRKVLPYLPSLSIISRKLEELTNNQSPFAIILPKEENPYNLNQLTKQWQEKVKTYNRQRRMFLGGTLATTATALWYSFHQSLPQAIMEEIPQAAQAAYEEVIKILGENPQSSFLGRLRQTKKVLDLLGKIKADFNEKVLFAVGNNFFRRYTEQQL